MREETCTKYYADDGSVFTTKRECEEYERNVNVKLDEVLSDIYLKELDKTVPAFYRESYFDANRDTLPGYINTGMDHLDYQWFELCNEADFYRLLKAAPENSKLARLLRKPEAFPEVIAIELSSSLTLMALQKNSKYTGRYAYMNEDKKKILNVFGRVNEVLMLKQMEKSR